MSDDTEVAQSEDVLDILKTFIENDVLQQSGTVIEPTTPLLEWGILTSLTTMRVVAFIRQRFEVFVPPERIVGANFANLNALTRMVLELRAESPA
jgi:acyl carrier protein